MENSSICEQVCQLASKSLFPAASEISSALVNEVPNPVEYMLIVLQKCYHNGVGSHYGDANNAVKMWSNRELTAIFSDV